jgi:hypothetical protein
VIAGCPVDLGIGDDLVHQADVQRLGRAHETARVDDVLGPRGADEPGQPLGAAGPGDDPQQDLGLAEARALTGHPEVGAQRQFEAAAERVSGHRGHHRLADPGDSGESRLEAAAVRRHLGEAGLRQLLDVRAGREDLLAAVEHHGTDLRIGVGLRRGGRDLVLDPRVERVHRRPVQTYGRDRLVALHPDELAHTHLPPRS